MNWEDFPFKFPYIFSKVSITTEIIENDLGRQKSIQFVAETRSDHWHHSLKRVSTLCIYIRLYTVRAVIERLRRYQCDVLIEGWTHYWVVPPHRYGILVDSMGNLEAIMQKKSTCDAAVIPILWRVIDTRTLIQQPASWTHLRR